MQRNNLYPALKLIIFLISIFIISLLKVIPVFIIILIVANLYALLVLRKYRSYIKFILPVFVITFFIGLPSVLSVISPGKSIITINGSGITEEGVNIFLRFFLRTASIVSIAGIYVLIQEIGEFIRAMKFLKVPDEVIFVFLVMMRYMKIFEEELNEFLVAKRLRVLGKHRTYDELKWTAVRSGLLFKKLLNAVNEMKMALNLRFAGKRIVLPLIFMGIFL